MKKMQPTRWMPANGKEGKLERFISQNGSSEFEALLDQTEVDLFELNRPKDKKHNEVVVIPQGA